MKKLIISVACLFIFVPSLALAESQFKPFEDWDKWDKGLFGSFIVGQALNYAQTNYVYKSQKWYEINPVIDFMSNKGSNLLEYKIVSTVGISILAHVFPKYRKHILITSNVVVFGFVGHDLRAGVRFKF